MSEIKLCQNCGGRSQIIGDDGELEYDKLDEDGLCRECSKKKFYIAAELRNK